MKDMITIVVRLTLSCLLAATIMGVCFIFTSNAKKHNEHVKEQRVAYSLLGYKAGAPIHESLAMHEIYRYLVTNGNRQVIGYLLPQGKEENKSFLLVTIDLDGKLVGSREVVATEAEVLDTESRNKKVNDSLETGFTAQFVDQTIVVSENGARVAYLLKGKFQGFKTFVHVMLAVDPSFEVLGLEILEHEEDPGLGAEIEQKYFKNQFIGKAFETLKQLGVVKEPLPEEYNKALNAEVDAEQVRALTEKYKDQDIYALTGATISSRCVVNGVKGIVTKFAYRINVLDRVLKEQNLSVSF